MARYTCEFDGTLCKYYFGAHHDKWQVEATSLSRAIRAFRVAALFPHQYSSGRIATPATDDRGYSTSIYLSSTPGSVVPVEVLAETRKGRQWVRVGEIPPEGEEAADYRAALLPPEVQDVQTSDTTALQVGGAITGLDSASRREIEDRQRALTEKMGQLDRMRQELAQQRQALLDEVRRRQKQIWMIELFLGTQEEVYVLRTGEPAPAHTPITVRQRTLCMDEEVAVFDWVNNPDRVGEFDHSNIEDFDRWLLDDPAHLAAIMPHPKGIVALRVRRHEKRRHAKDMLAVFANVQAAQADAMTYLLVRNGENLYRMWVDVRLWPRLLARVNEFDPSKKHKWPGDEKRAEDNMRRYVAGAIVVQGLLERSTLFAPLPAAKVSIFNPDHVDRYFNLVRDDEGTTAITDGDPLRNLTWDRYQEWLRGQLREGVRVLWLARKSYGDDKLYERTQIHSVTEWPDPAELYQLNETGLVYYKYSFLYLPEDRIWDSDGWDSHKRKKRVRFYVYEDEVVPYDAISPRVVKHLLLDRGQREHYADYFKLLLHWYRLKVAERKRERPFIDLMLRTSTMGDPDSETDRARAERLVRWWKMKTKEVRDIDSDSAKALRMITAAFDRGDDYDNDPERLLFARATDSEDQ